jgi:hypothetical protein
MSSINVEAKLVGRRQPLVNGWTVSLKGDRSKLTLAELLSEIVLAEVEAFHDRQEQQRLPQILTRDAILWGLTQGKVAMGGREFEAQKVDPQAAIATALQAFTDGLYYVFIDDVQYESLDATVQLQPHSNLLFLRLVALAGG